MFGWWNRLGRGGAAAAEFALFLPMFALLLVGIIEYGRLLAQTSAVEKGLRAGATVAARSLFPLTTEARGEIENVVKTGTVDGAGQLLVPGWAKTGASLVITTTTFSSGTVSNLPVVRLEATVPYDPLLPGLLDFVGIADLKIESAHEQAFLIR